MEVKGKVKMVGMEQQVSASFKKRELVVTTDENYPQHILIEFNQDKCDVLNNYKVGDSVKVDINLRGREWINPQGEAKYFNQIQGWRITKTEQVNNSAPNRPQTPSNSQQFEPVNNNFKEEDEDDAPF